MHHPVEELHVHFNQDGMPGWGQTPLEEYSVKEINMSFTLLQLLLIPIRKLSGLMSR